MSTALTVLLWAAAVAVGLPIVVMIMALFSALVFAVRK